MMHVADAAEGAGQSARRTRASVIALTLFAAASLAHNLSIAAHEFGHAVGTWLGGGEVIEFVVNPLATSHVYAGPEFTHEHGLALHTWGGVVLGTVIGILCLTAAGFLRRGTIWWIVLYFTGAVSLLINGMYLAMGSVRPFGDAWSLVNELNTPRAALFLAGLPIVVGFMCVFPLFLRGIGLRGNDSFGKWLLVNEIGLVGCSLAFAIGQMLWARLWSLTASSELGFLVGATAVFVVPVTAFAYWIARRRPNVLESTTAEPTWSRAAMILVLAASVLALELAIVS
jgi:hypothetical protein